MRQTPFWVILFHLFFMGCSNQQFKFQQPPAPVEDRTQDAIPAKKSLPQKTTTSAPVADYSAPEPVKPPQKAVPKVAPKAAPKADIVIHSLPPSEAFEANSSPPPDKDPPSPSPKASSPAVLTLASIASAAEKAGEYEQAAASLERALNIDPDDAVLWHRLARIRLNEKRWKQAETCAIRSNRLTFNNLELRRKNFSLIARARRALGDRAGAASASREANLLR